MSERPVRCLHASDLHLEQPLHGVAEVPEHLVDAFLDAPLMAAEQVFDAAVSESVDFLLLAGDVIRPKVAGPRGLNFLLEQFRRLDNAGIAVYWSVGRADSVDDWPTAVPLPPNVSVFSDEHVDSVTHRRGNRAIAVIQGQAIGESLEFNPLEFDSDVSLPTIALVYGQVDASAIQQSDIDYWALGGMHSPQVVNDSGSIAYYSGSPQGRRPSESGAHGCMLVEIDSIGNLTRQTITTDVIRWENVEIELPDQIDPPGLLRILRERTHHLLETSGNRQLLVRWCITDSDETTDTKSDQLVARLREGGLADQMLESLRHEFASAVPGVWHVEFDIEPPTAHPAGWYEEDTVLGDLLRVVKRYQESSEKHLPMAPPPEDHQLSDELARFLNQSLPEERQMILRRVAALGVDLLRGDRVLSDEYAGRGKSRGIRAASGATLSKSLDA